MVNCIMGVGVLGYPYCFKSSGALLATLAMLITALASRASYQLLLHAAHLSGQRTYQQARAVGWWCSDRVPCGWKGTCGRCSGHGGGSSNSG
jgi:hypothetical protein